ncbi:MAG: hypothetical protein PHI35_08310 [Victivallaceae bacterium]|nr:hypothetical protein [Victivallaceae bacterium]
MAIIKTEAERDTLIDQLAVAAAYLRFRAPLGGGYPKPAEVAAARQQIVNDPACAKIFAPTENECASLLRAHGFTPPVVRRVDQKKT